MSQLAKLGTTRTSTVAALVAVALMLSLVPVRPAEASISQSLIALAKPLADQFGVPTNAVQGLFEKGISLESATQLLLVSQSSKTAIDDVTKVYEDSSRNIETTADKLKVDASVYSPANVQASIDKAKADAAASAQKKAADEANKAVGSALGGFMK